MKKILKICMWLLFALANVSWVLLFISVSYSWGYAQSAIDHHVAAFSAPAYLNLINGVPWLLGTIVLGGFAFAVYRKIK